MKLKITGVVKYGGAWKRPGDLLEDVAEAIGKQMIDQDVAVAIEKTAAEKEVEETERAAAEAAKKAEKELKALRKKAADLGIEGADGKDAETLKAEIAAKEQK